MEEAPISFGLKIAARGESRSSPFSHQVLYFFFSPFVSDDSGYIMASRGRRSGAQTPTTPEMTSFEVPAITRTNTLVITSLPLSFFTPAVLDALRAHFESYGDIHTWAPIKAFARVIVIYYDEEAAELAKESCDSLFVGETSIR